MLSLSIPVWLWQQMLESTGAMCQSAGVWQESIKYWGSVSYAAIAGPLPVTLKTRIPADKFILQFVIQNGGPGL